MVGPRRWSLFIPRGSSLIPGETLIGLVVVSPLLAVLLIKNAVEGAWSTRLHVIAGTFVYACAIALALHAVFNGLLARLRAFTKGHWVRFGACWVAAVVVVTAVTQAFVPVFGWMNLSFDPWRRIVQGGVVVSFYLAAAFLFKHATQRIADEQGRALEERAAALDARLQALQARTNPHFLFNSLNSIMSLIATDPSQAEVLIARLSTLLRYSIEGADRSNVSLREELDAVRDYLAIEQARFGDRLRVELELDDGVDVSVRVPPMILQPLVENAILHGVARSVSGGLVRIAVVVVDHDRVSLTVDDSGASAEASPHMGTKTAMANLEERLRIMYGDNGSLVLGRQAGSGFRACVTIPGARSS